MVERVIWPNELSAADEIFLTGTAAEITPVGAIDDLTFRPGRLTARLIDDYDAIVRQPAVARGETAAA